MPAKWMEHEGKRILYVDFRKLDIVMVVRECRQLPLEFVVRGYITGSAWKEYRELRYIPAEEIPGRLAFTLFKLNKHPIPGDPDYAAELTCPSPVCETEAAGEVG